MKGEITVQITKLSSGQILVKQYSPNTGVSTGGRLLTLKLELPDDFLDPCSLTISVNSPGLEKAISAAISDLKGFTDETTADCE